jgi:hypothetical protein
VQVQIEGSYDPEIGFTVSFTHIEESGFYDCRVVDQDEHNYQFHVMVNENCESNDNCSSDAIYANNTNVDITPIDESTTNFTLSSELSRRQELSEIIKAYLSGDGLTAKHKRSGWSLVVVFT